MINRENFHNVYQRLNLCEYDIEEYLYRLLSDIIKNLAIKSHNNPKIIYEEQMIFDYMIQEFKYTVPLKDKELTLKMLSDEKFNRQFVSIVVDKFFFNEITPYFAVSLMPKTSPVVSTMELNLNFILNRIGVIKKIHQEKDILIDMFSKVFLMFKSINYLLTSGFETEAFSTWRTVHELECVIKLISENPYVISSYLKHIVYNSAFRDEFKDKDEQQATIDDLKMHMKEHNLKSKDMKKYIEYGWLYSIEGIEEKFPGFKLNFRNGLELAAGLERYSQDYEMSSEVAHSSPLLIYSNKAFFKSITIVRSYESFIRLEELFYNHIKKYDDIDHVSYENMRSLYLKFISRILNRELQNMNQLIFINAKKRMLE